MPPPPSTYQYLGLTEPDSIRILLLFPSSQPTSEVKCDLIHARLSENIEGKNSYTTLSYVWGNERDSHSVRVRDKRLTVGRNVDSALRHLRRRDLPIRLWVDAICINQLDLTERNHQVHQMRAIYSASQETIIYLGDEDGGNTCNSAWNFLERHCHWAMNKNHDIDYTLPTARENILEFRGDLEDVGSDVLKRAWFRRVWVFQEVVVSQKLSIQCGNRRIPWDDFCKILLLSPRHHDQYGLSMSRSEEIDAVRDMFQARCSYQKTHGLEHLRPSWHADVEDYKGQSSDVLNVLARSRRLESSDPRDKIFALLGISTGIDLDDEKVAINYRKPCVLVYRDFARYIMETTNSYDLLSYLDKNLVGAERTLLETMIVCTSTRPSILSTISFDIMEHKTLFGQETHLAPADRSMIFCLHGYQTGTEVLGRHST
jgi:Heterokaryon incompatibility protein (HET)